MRQRGVRDLFRTVFGPGDEYVTLVENLESYFYSDDPVNCKIGTY